MQKHCSNAEAVDPLMLRIIMVCSNIIEQSRLEVRLLLKTATVFCLFQCKPYFLLTLTQSYLMH